MMPKHEMTAKRESMIQRKEHGNVSSTKRRGEARLDVQIKVTTMVESRSGSFEL